MTHHETGSASNVVRLTPFRAAMERARRLGRVDALLAAPDVRREIGRVPAEEIYWVVREAGIADARGLVALCAADQVQRFLDLDIWRGQEVDIARAWPWVDAIFAGGWERAAKTLWRLDIEILGLLVTSSFEVVEAYELMDPPPGARATPDGRFYLVYKGPAEDEATAFKVIDALYADDNERIMRFLTQARSEIQSDLEETALQFQSARRAEMGFVPFDEAIAVYRKLRPSEAKAVARAEEKKNATGFPLVLVEPLAGDSLLARALDALEDRDEVESVVAELAFLANAVVSADRVEPDDKAKTARSFERVRDWISLGLETLAAQGGPPLHALVREFALRDLFAVGHAVVAERIERARALRAQGPWRLGDDGPFALLDAPWSDAMSELAEKRPDGIRSGADLARLDRLLDEVSAIARIRDALGITREAVLSIDLTDAVPPDRASLTISKLVVTAMAFRATSGAASLAAFPVSRLDALRKSPHLWAAAANALFAEADAPLALSFSAPLIDYLASRSLGEAVDPRVASAWFLLRP